MAAVVGMGDNLLARLQTEHADTTVIIRKDRFLIPLGVIKFLQFLHIENL
jgi:hypothetical protein